MHTTRAAAERERRQESEERSLVANAPNSCCLTRTGRRLVGAAAAGARARRTGCHTARPARGLFANGGAATAGVRREDGVAARGYAQRGVRSRTGTPRRGKGRGPGQPGQLAAAESSGNLKAERRAEARPAPNIRSTMDLFDFVPKAQAAMKRAHTNYKLPLHY